MMDDERRPSKHDIRTRARLNKPRAAMPDDLGPRGKIGKTQAKSGKYPSGAHGKGTVEQRAGATKARLKRKNRKAEKEAPRGDTKAARNAARALRAARGATVAGAAAEFGGLIADTMNPQTELDMARQRRLAELFREEPY